MGEVLTAIQNSISPIFPSLDLIVVDDQSEDETAVRASHAGAHVVSTNKIESGLASAFRLGVQSGLDAGATVFLNIDADGQYKASEALRLLWPLADGAYLVIGNRLHRRPEWMSLSRYVGNRAYSPAILVKWTRPIERRLPERFPSLH